MYRYAEELALVEGLEGGDDMCDYVVVQGGSKMPAGLQRAARRLEVRCVQHDWVVESLLANSLTAKRIAQYTV